ncbi:putative disease resistance protein rga4 [Quercus suber]|uniref:Disease resistance protein rga4 n=1 Tax=Quercus suber TaxID=58331 RepID=A0AAW0JCI6_QUESU
MGRGRDPFWAHAEKVNGCLKFKCIFCKRDFAGGASRIKAHLAGVSGHDIVACNAVPLDVQNQARATQKKREAQATQGTNKKLKSASTSASKLKTKDKEGYMAEIVLNDVVERLIANAFSLIATENICFESSFKTIKQLLDKIVHDVAGFGLRMELVNSIPSISSDMNIDPLLNDSEVVGREYDVTKIVNVLISSSNQQVISVLPIVGMAGLGKTTLAKLVYNNELIKKHFDVLAWVNVGIDFNVEEILGEIISLEEDLSDEILQICAEKLRAIKYLLILDDVQEEDHVKWDTLKGYLLKFNSSTGNNIVVTTRSDNVAKIMETHPKHQLEKLSKDDSPGTSFSGDGFIKVRTAEEDRYDKDEKVLEGLQPHPNLKSLRIEWYLGKKFPSWVGLSSLYHNLIEINLMRCWNCEEVPTLGQLPCLRVLEIYYMEKVRSIGSEFYFYSDGSYRNTTTTTLFPALRILILGWMDSLEEWKDAKELTTADEVFPCLEELTLIQCEKLRDLPNSLHTCVSLQKLVVQECYELRSLPGVPSVIQHLEITECDINELPNGLQSCTSLQYLNIGDCPNLKSMPESLHSCVSLQKLVVWDCCKLSSLPGVPSVIQHLEIAHCGINELPNGLQFCASLQYLKIEECPNLKSIPDLGELFRSLINLKLSNCSDLRLTLSRREGRLKTLVIGGFIEEILRYPFIRYSHASLKRLKLHGSPTLNSLPNEIQLFTALEELRIQNFNGMEALPDWFSCLSSLQKLSLYYCKKLMYLPILHLTDLKHLHIARCPNLEKRCAEESSAEWLQMPHIRNIKINEKYIKGKDSEDSEDFDDYDDYEDSDDSEDDSQYKYIPFLLAPNLFIDGSYRNTTLFPALRIPKLDWMPRLEEWKDAKELTSASEVLVVFPCLEKLFLLYCRELRYLPGVPSVIQHLEIIGCDIDELPSGLQFCTSLQYLKIDCPNLKSIPDLGESWMLSDSALSFHPILAHVHGRPTLNFLPNEIQLFTALEEMRIQKFNRMEALLDWLSLIG